MSEKVRIYFIKNLAKELNKFILLSCQKEKQKINLSKKVKIYFIKKLAKELNNFILLSSQTEKNELIKKGQNIIYQDSSERGKQFHFAVKSNREK